MSQYSRYPALGTVKSVALTVPNFLSVSGSPITSSGTLAISLATQTANLVFAGPASGSAAAPTFRSLAYLDIPVSAESNAGNSGATLTLNFATLPTQKVTLTASCTFTFSNPRNGETYILKLVQGGAGSFLVTWPITVKWPGGTAPTLSTAIGAVDIITLYYDGTSYYGSSGIGYA